MSSERTLSGEKIDLGKGSVAWYPCHIGKSATIAENCSIGSLAHIGRAVSMGSGCRIQGGAYVADGCILGKQVFIGPNATLLNDKYPPSGNKGQWQPIAVGNGVVIGGGATVVAGCTIAENSVLAAGSTLTHSMPANEVWAGNPARYLSSRQDYDEKQAELKAETSALD
jgi:acetyltransferase-like isoleucine patch superfamily enzyme